MWKERRLPRLAQQHYQGSAHVLWTYVVKDRRRGWLDTAFHSLFRETLLHTCARYHLGCARYVLMPDHMHLIWVGAIPASDQLKANKFLRRHLPLEWQKQAHDHILREEERKRNAFADACLYLRQNPVRAGLVDSAQDWAFKGSLVPGFPDLDPLQSDAFWRCFQAYRNALLGEV
jgi:REP element-mobilizing transposase RayT